MHQKKAISPIISIIIILLITVAIAGAGFSYISVYWTGLMSKQIEILPSYCTSNRAAITLRNIGTSGINNSDHEAMVGLFEPDGSTVGMWRFDESDGNASLDSSGQGNTGTIYGNTVLLMHFDEDDGNATLDSTSYGNTGSIFGDTVLLMHFDNGSGATADDETSYGNEGTLQGNLETSGWKTSGCQSGSCLEFDGTTSDYIIKNPYNNFPSTEITAAFWMKSSDTTNSGTAISYASSQSDNDFLIYNYNSFGIHVNTSSVGTGVSATDGQWHHIAVTWRSSDGQAKLYKDGEEAYSGTVSAGKSIQAGGALVIGQEQDSIGGGFAASQAFNGTLDEVAIYSRALTGDEINASYQAGKAKFIERVEGKSGNGMGFDGTAGCTSPCANYGLISTPTFSLGQSLTVCFWANPRRSETKEMVIHGTSTSGGFELYQSGTDAILRGAGHSPSVAGSGALALNTWRFICGVINGTTGKIYSNGSLLNTGDVVAPDSGTVSLYIGSYSNGDYAFNGSIDEVAIYSQALTGDEINASYQAGKAKFIEHVEGRFGYAMEFDGDGDYVDLENNELGNFGTDNFTISFWSKITINNAGFIISKGNITTTDGWHGKFFNWLGAPVFEFRYGDGSTAKQLNYQPIDLNEWVNIVIKREGKYAYLYYNGENKHELSGSNIDIDSTPFSLFIGRESDTSISMFNGTIDEVIIFNRSLSASEIQAQVKPACSCSGNTCQCGELTVTRTYGDGYFHPYFDNETFSPGQSLTMTDYNCLGGRCEYRITLPAGSYETTVFCS